MLKLEQRKQANKLKTKMKKSEHKLLQAKTGKYVFPKWLISQFITKEITIYTTMQRWWLKRWWFTQPYRGG